MPWRNNVLVVIKSLKDLKLKLNNQVVCMQNDFNNVWKLNTKISYVMILPVFRGNRIQSLEVSYFLKLVTWWINRIATRRHLRHVKSTFSCLCNSNDNTLLFLVYVPKACDQIIQPKRLKIFEEKRNSFLTKNREASSNIYR